MTDVRRLDCPACHYTEFEHDSDGNLVCRACGTRIASPRPEVTCRTCGTVNPATAMRCMKCAAVLSRICSTCDHENPPGLTYCEECGVELDTLSAVTSRAAQGSASIQSRMRERLVETKAADDAFMAATRERLREEERARLALLAEQAKKAKAEQTRLIMVFVGAGILFSLCLGVVLFVVF